ncbi:ATP-binding protein [Vitiosangium sp. GDMCC 1.1324]|uniref:sensor histidine kinase n=1 Tax=Vitiosangium sp. (strain GDMCC 1.1324) TaxID=2138576 RepID=UPI000D34FB94|nr:ATP-binding protein [Vitiosangium sp. GDMCC 1.1324]PTL83959.1 histidine kinase [Vitiosangium sp. GDMCC 1.1324]
MSDTAEYRPLDGLPAPTLVTRGEQVIHANPALLALLGVGMEEIRDARPLELLARFSPADRSWLEPMHADYTRGATVPDKLWLRVHVTGGQERTYCLRRGSGLRPEDTLLMLVDAEGEASMRRLTEALVEASGELVHCRDEQAVLEMAAEAIHRQGFFVTVLLLEGDALVHGPMRQDPAQVATGEQLPGKPGREVRVPRASMPHLEEVLARRKAVFHHDLFGTLGGMRHDHSIVRALDAPIFVEGVPFGFLSIQGETLTPTSAATLELFARQVGGALENVRHHRSAAARLAELSRLQSELVAQERLTVLGEAAGVVAHEVRNPLGAILNAVAVLKRDKLGTIGTSAVEMLEEEATRLDAMVRDLLDVVRPLEPRPRPLHPGELARRTLELFRERRQLGQVRVSVDEAPDVPTLQADETLLQLALENLLRNAVQASPPRGEVRVVVRGVPEGLSLIVEDEGPGVSPADAQRLFEPFFTTRTTGTGLGLAVVRRVVLAHGGTVSVGQRPGGGARFELRLPLQCEPRPLPPLR